MENIEIWKTIENYPDYQISNMGRVKSLNYGKTGEEKILKQEITNNGYFRVNLYKDKKRKHFSVHRLVATHFIPNSQNLPCVNHKDENPQNNYASNLEWCTQKYNINYGSRNAKVSKAHKGRVFSKETKKKMSKAKKGKKQSQEHIEKCVKARQKPILQFNKEGTKIIGKFISAKQASKELNINRGDICKCCKGKLKTCAGSKWLYLEDYVNRMEKLYQLTLKKAS